MQTSNNSLIQLNNTRDSLSYINDLVVQATSEGLYFIFVDSTYMDDNMMNDLITNYGYIVTKRTNDFGSFITYLINWDEGYFETEGVLYITNELGVYLDVD